MSPFTKTADEKYRAKTLLESPESSATVIHALLLELFGPDVYDWDPATVYLEVQAEFSNADMSSEAMDRWCAMSVLMTSDAYFKRLDAFLNITQAFAEGAPAFTDFDKPSLEACAWALTEAALNREFLPFSPAIKTFLRELLKEDGYSPGNYPAVFAEVFDKEPDSSAIKEGLAETENKTNIDLYIDEELRDVVSQFAKVPHLPGIDDIIRNRSLDEAMRNNNSDERNRQ